MWRKLFFVNINYRYYYSPKNKPINTLLSIITIINGNVNVIYYDSKYVVTYYLISVYHNYFSSLTPLHVPIEENGNIMDENNRRETIEFEKSVSIGTQ